MLGRLNPDIISAVVAYLRWAMGGSLFVTETNDGVWSTYATSVPVNQPYCVVRAGPETYEFISDDLEGGHSNSVITDGVLHVGFVAPGEEQAWALGRQCVRVLNDTQAEFHAADGRVIYLRPVRSDSVFLTDSGPSIPAVFKRVVTVEYRQQFRS